MRTQTGDLHGNAPSDCPVALLLIDVINDMEYPGDVLLEYLGARTLILTGLTADRCLLMTASDAYLRAYTFYVPSDCTASIVPAHNQQTLDYMARVLRADTTPSDALDLVALASGTSSVHRGAGRVSPPA